MFRRGLLVTMVAALLVLVGGGVAAAACPAPAGGPGSTAAPVDASQLPADLRQFQAGTEEFRAAPWFTGTCASKGGDLGAYVTAAFRQEDRLLWWSDPANAGKPEPPHEDLPKVFPYSDGEFDMPSACADDLAAGAHESSNAWGFTWTEEPDRASVDAMIAAAAPYGDVPVQAWSAPCKMDNDAGMYCAHALFLDCTKAAANINAGGPCARWNQAVGKLFGGTAHWLDQNTSFGDRFKSAVGANPLLQGGKWLVEAEIAGAKMVLSAA
jgi:hypothetical protein